MNNAIDPIGASTPYAVTPKSMRANQTETEEQIDLIKKLEADEQNHNNDDTDGHGDTGDKKNEYRRVVDVVQLSSTAVRRDATDAGEMTDDTTGIDDDQSETVVQRHPVHIDVKA